MRQATRTLVCEVADTGVIKDHSFNEATWDGLEDARTADPSIMVTYLRSNSPSDYLPNIETFINEKCDLIVTVEPQMAKVTEYAANAFPSQHFVIVDYEYTSPIKNVRALVYESNQDAFLGGYLAAAMSRTGRVGTFGAERIPTITRYMDGWVAGVRYYNKLKHKHVVALGWIPKKSRPTGSYEGTGLITNSFTNLADGETDATALIQQGADAIFPVAGEVGLGAAKVVAEQKGVTMEWVDTDGCVSDPLYCKLFLTSVTKGIVPTVERAALDEAHGSFAGGDYLGTLANNGVALAPFHDYVKVIPTSVQKELAKLRTEIISGKISVDPNSYPVG